MSRKVSPISQHELDSLEGIIRNGLQSFVAVGLALVEIRQTKAYRLRGHSTFESYCKETFDFTARHGRRMMAAAKAAAAVASATGDQPKDEYAARALVPIAGDTQALNLVKRRLEQRGVKLSAAPGGLIDALLKGGHAHKGTAHSQDKITRHSPVTGGESDACPGCGQRPARYFYRPLEGGWLCSHCSGVVRLVVLRR